MPRAQLQARVFDAVRALVDFLKRVFRKNTGVSKQCRLKVWKTIRVGAYNTVEEFQEDVQRSGIKFTHWTLQLLKNSSCKSSANVTWVKLARTNLAGLGFTGRTSIERVREKVLALGGMAPSLETAFCLRLEYREQPYHERLIVLIDPIRAGILGTPGILRIGHDCEGLWMYGYYLGADPVIDPDDELVFVVP